MSKAAAFAKQTQQAKAEPENKASRLVAEAQTKKISKNNRELKNRDKRMSLYVTQETYKTLQTMRVSMMTDDGETTTVNDIINDAIDYYLKNTSGQTK